MNDDDTQLNPGVANISGKGNVIGNPPLGYWVVTSDTGCASSPADEARARVERAIEHWGRYSRQQDERLHNAEMAGTELAGVVQRFLADPAAVGTDALYAAYGKFMAQHAGNFGPATQ